MPPSPTCVEPGPPSRELTEVFCRVPSTQFSQAPWYALPVHLCRFRVRSHERLFPGTLRPPPQSDKEERRFGSVTSLRLRNINRIPIDYAFRPRLRGRLTLLRLALSRNPWTFGESVSHTLYRYSCQHSRFCTLHRTAYAPASMQNPSFRCAAAVQTACSPRSAPPTSWRGQVAPCAPLGSREPRLAQAATAFASSCRKAE